MTANAPREITAPVDLCLPNGRLNPDARRLVTDPVAHREPARVGAEQALGVLGHRHAHPHRPGAVVSSLDYAGVGSLYALDRGTGREWRPEAGVPLARDTVLPPTSGDGTAYATGKDLEITLDQDAHGTHLRAAAGQVRLDLRVAVTPDHDALAVVVPWSERRFLYTVKDLGRPVEGTLTLDGTNHHINAADSFAVLDHGVASGPIR